MLQTLWQSLYIVLCASWCSRKEVEGARTYQRFRTPCNLEAPAPFASRCPALPDALDSPLMRISIRTQLASFDGLAKGFSFKEVRRHTDRVRPYEHGLYWSTGSSEHQISAAAGSFDFLHR